jgi:hypothetical protein
MLFTGSPSHYRTRKSLPARSHADEGTVRSSWYGAAQPRERRRQVLDGAPVTRCHRGGTLDHGGRDLVVARCVPGPVDPRQRVVELAEDGRLRPQRGIPRPVQSLARVPPCLWVVEIDGEAVRRCLEVSPMGGRPQRRTSAPKPSRPGSDSRRGGPGKFQPLRVARIVAQDQILTEGEPAHHRDPSPAPAPSPPPTRSPDDLRQPRLRSITTGQ